VGHASAWPKGTCFSVQTAQQSGNIGRTLGDRYDLNESVFGTVNHCAGFPVPPLTLDLGRIILRSMSFRRGWSEQKETEL
jgi:hypothetical protein